VDYDIRGLVGIRLIDASARDARTVSEQIGCPQATLPREPDLTIRFVREIPTRGAVLYVEPGELGFTEDAFLVLRSGLPCARLRLDLLGVGSRVDLRDGVCHIVCRSESGPVPLLRPIVDLTLLGRGAASVHAAAFAYKGKGTMIAGWPRGAKTTTLLAFMANGAEFIADDRVYLNPAGNRLLAPPQPISLRLPHLDELPQYRKLVRLRHRARLRALSLVGELATAIAGPAAPGSGRKLADRVAGFAEDASVAVEPDRLFERCAFGGDLQIAFLSLAHESNDVRVERVSPRWLADRLRFLLQADRQRFVAHYLAFRFAFPERTSELIEHASEIEHSILLRALGSAETYVVYHPHPAPAQALFETMAACFT
jgi:hypothetical protein